MNNLSTQIATTREQSERLLAMGVKPETADMHYSEMPTIAAMTDETCRGISNDETEDVLMTGRGFPTSFPAWSLSRLISMMPSEITVDRKVGGLFISHIDIPYFGFKPDKSISFLIGFAQGYDESVFDICIDMIDWLIESNHFNKYYLKGDES